MTVYREMPMKKVLHNSVEYKHDRNSLIILSVMMAFYLLIAVFLLVTVVAEEPHQASAGYSDIEDPMVRSAMQSLDDEWQARHNEAVALAVTSVIILSLVLTAFVVYYSVRLNRLLKNPDRYVLCEMTLSDPGTFARATSFTVTLQTPEGRQIVKQTRTVFTQSRAVRMAAGRDLWGVYDPEGDRFACLVPEEEVPMPFM